MPVFNGEPFIEEAVQSFLRQTYTNFELIISDNASSDATEEIGRAFAASDDRIRYLRQSENQGSVYNFNSLVGLSHGTYFKWAASDDFCKPTYLQSVVKILETNPEVVWCHSQSRLVDGNGLPLAGHDGLTPVSETLRADYNSPSRHKRFRGILLGTNWCADSFGLFRKSALQKTGLLPSCYGSEKVLIGELGLMGRYDEVPEALFFQRVHAASSGNMENLSTQIRYISGKRRKRLHSTRLELLLGHVRAVNNVPMSSWDRIRCYSTIAQYLFQLKKWPKIINADLRGYPLGKYSL